MTSRDEGGGDLATPLLHGTRSLTAPSRGIGSRSTANGSSSGCDEPLLPRFGTLNGKPVPHAPHLHRRSCDLGQRHRVPSLQDLDVHFGRMEWHERFRHFLHRRCDFAFWSAVFAHVEHAGV